MDGDKSEHRVIEITDWSQIHRIADLSPLWAFRGQSDARWTLETTLHRAALNTHHDLADLSNREEWMLYQFRRRAHHYLSNLPSDEDPLNWLAIMQHYGAPTRLLDFSHSIYVASFFACETATTMSAIWGVNLFPLLWRTADAFHDRIDSAKRREVVKANQILLGPTSASLDVLSVEPERMHERLALQQGLFLFPSDITASFEANLASALGINPAAFNKMQPDKGNNGKIDQQTFVGLRTCKILLPENLFKKALADLHNMNINSTTLFPGLDGFARSLYYHFAV